MHRVTKATIKKTDLGLVPEGEGWYVMNVREARWRRNEKFGMSVKLEGDQSFPQYGVNLAVMEPGQPNCHYHGEEDQEDFLVLSGECRLIIEGEEKLLKQWDFVHCPAWTNHVFVGAGTGPCALLMIGGRAGTDGIYPIDPIAQKYNASAPRETKVPAESYAECPKTQPSKSRWPV